jgi:hypothetical protein
VQSDCPLYPSERTQTRGPRIAGDLGTVPAIQSRTYCIVVGRYVLARKKAELCESSLKHAVLGTESRAVVRVRMSMLSVDTNP